MIKQIDGFEYELKKGQKIIGIVLEDARSYSVALKHSPLKPSKKLNKRVVHN